MLISLDYKKKMKLKYSLWYFIIFTVHFFCWYYVLVFCNIYPNASRGWIIGCLMSLGFDLLFVQLVAPVGKGILRAFIKMYPTK